jgi:hypothetical protein
VLERSSSRWAFQDAFRSSIGGGVDLEGVGVGDFGGNQPPLHEDHGPFARLRIDSNDGLACAGCYVPVGRELESASGRAGICQLASSAAARTRSIAAAATFDESGDLQVGEPRS